MSSDICCVHTQLCNPATWSSTKHGCQSVVIFKFIDDIHACVPKYGISISWSLLWEEMKGLC